MHTPTLRDSQPAQRRNAGLVAAPSWAPCRGGTPCVLKGTKAASPLQQELRLRGGGEGGATREGAGSLGHTPCVTARGPSLARGESRGGGVAEAVRVGRAYLGPALRPPGKPGVLRRDSSYRQQGAWSSDRRPGRNHKWLRPLRHDTRPRPSRRLPGGRQGAGVCAGADLGTVGGGGGLGQYRVRAAWRGRDGGRCGQAWPPREDARGPEPHPRGAPGKLTCGGRGPRWFLGRADLSLCPACLLPASHVGKLRPGRSRARPR